MNHGSYRCVDYKIIDVHDGSTSECWLKVYRDGSIKLRSENSGHRILRHGAETMEELVSMADVEELELRHGKQLVKQVRDALAEFGCT